MTLNYEKRIENLTSYLLESDFIIADLQDKYEKEKNDNIIYSKKLNEYFKKIETLNEVITGIEKVVVIQNDQMDILRTKSEEFYIKNKTLQKSLDEEEDRYFNLETKNINLEKELEQSKNRIASLQVENLEDINYISVYIPPEEPVTEISLFDEINQTEDNSLYETQIKELNDRIKKDKIFYEKYLWFYRGFSAVCLGGVIYATTEMMQNYAC